jgi:hypothetical protein
MTDDCHRFALTKEMAREVLCPFVGAHRIRIEKAAGNHQRVKFLGVCLIEREIYFELVAFLRVIHTLDFAGFERYDCRLRSGFIERRARLCHFHLFKAIRHKDGHLFSVEFSCHKILSR